MRAGQPLLASALPHSSQTATEGPGPREGAACCSLRSCPDLGLDSEELGGVSPRPLRPQPNPEGLTHSVMSNSLRPRGLQHTWFPCPSLSQSLLKLMSIDSVMPSNHLILCHSLFLLPSIFLNIGR